MPGSQQHEKSFLIRKTVANFNIAVARRRKVLRSRQGKPSVSEWTLASTWCKDYRQKVKVVVASAYVFSNDSDD